MIIRFFPLAWIVLFAGFGVFGRAWLQFRRHGHSGIVLFRSASWPQRMRDVLFVLLSALVISQVLVFAVSPRWLSTVLFAATPPWLVEIGAVLLFGGLLFMVAAQLGMGASWRVGIQEEARPGLVTGGLYQLCRNPIYLGMFISLVGLMAILPTWPTVLTLLGVLYSIRTQVFEEEAYLSQTYGDEYRKYAARIGRFVPGLGKLRIDG
jgi:protein-S-isoprenylcysteine O-methyltransferase Ste14